MTVRPIKFDSDRAEWLRMCAALWPEHPPEELAAEADEYAAGQTTCGHASAVFVVERDGGKLGGFIELTHRAVADGCATSAAAYIEGWYVDADLRRRGFGRKLVAAGEAWAIAKGFTEIASDCLSGNDVSHAAHRALGFEHSRRHIRFHKRLVNAPQNDEADWVGLMSTDLVVATVVKLVTDPTAGGIDVFLGTTRAEKDSAGRELLALDYEAYPDMATKQLHDLAKAAREKWPIIKLAILHRTGRVEPGEASVIIAVSTPHRADAFEACRWIIDALKKDVAIWKKEIWADGSGSWVNSR